MKDHFLPKNQIKTAESTSHICWVTDDDTHLVRGEGGINSCDLDTPTGTENRP